MSGCVRKSKAFDFIFALLVISLLFPGILSAGKKRTQGARVSVVQKDGPVVKGRLVSVDIDEQSIVVKNRDALAGTRLYAGEISHVVVKVSDVKMGKYAGTGLALGLVAGALTMLSAKEHSHGLFPDVVKAYAILTLPLVGMTTGYILGFVKKGKGKTFRLDNESPDESKIALTRLKRYAMIRN